MLFWRGFFYHKHLQKQLIPLLQWGGISVQNTSCNQSQEYAMENVPVKTWRTEITRDGNDFEVTHPLCASQSVCSLNTPVYDNMDNISNLRWLLVSDSIQAVPS